MSTPPGGMPPLRQGGILSLTIKDKSSLYAAYMPFIKNGGVFIAQLRAHRFAFGVVGWVGKPSIGGSSRHRWVYQPSLQARRNP